MGTLVCVLLAAFSGAAYAQTHIVIETKLGTIEAVLEDARAPKTVANFLRYVEAGRYDGGRFHRSVRSKPDNQPQAAIKIDVIQASVAPGFEKQAFAPVPLERTSVTGLKHVDGALSMARGAPDSATSDFFICIGPQPDLDFGGKRNPDGQGFAVFGRVTSGMEVVRRIHESPTAPTGSAEVVLAGNQRLEPPIGILNVRKRTSRD